MTEIATNCVYVGTETTGLDGTDEALAVAVVDADGTILLDSLVRPLHHAEWAEAQGVHGIDPAAVAGAPTLAELAPAVRAAVADRQVVAYHADFHGRVLGDLLSGAAGIHCCMEAWARDADEWDDYWGDVRYWSLADAAHEVAFKAPVPGRRPAVNVLACRAVWMHIHNPAVRMINELALEERRRSQDAQWEWERWDADAYRRVRKRAARSTRFWGHWWLDRWGVSHWTAQYGWHGREKAVDELCVVFFGTTQRGLEMLDRFPDSCFLHPADIPADLKRASWFHPAAWYRAELRPAGVLLRGRRVHLLYPRREKYRLNRKFRLRLRGADEDVPGTVVGSRSWLRRQGYGEAELGKPVAERYNMMKHFWYPIYRVPAR